MRLIYKVFTLQDWEDFRQRRVFSGSTADLCDGFIHFSVAEQTVETVARHFVGFGELVLAAVNADLLGTALRWEPSRAGALFPHLYGTLQIGQILWTKAFDSRRLEELRNLVLV